MSSRKALASNPLKDKTTIMREFFAPTPVQGRGEVPDEMEVHQAPVLQAVEPPEPVEPQRKVTFLLSESLFKKLKLTAVHRDQTMRDLVEEALKQYLGETIRDE